MDVYCNAILFSELTDPNLPSSSPVPLFHRYTRAPERAGVKKKDKASEKTQATGWKYDRTASERDKDIQWELKVERNQVKGAGVEMRMSRLENEEGRRGWM